MFAGLEAAGRSGASAGNAPPVAAGLGARIAQTRQEGRARRVRIAREEETVDEHEILDKIKDVVADKLDADPNDVSEESRFMEDLGADSLDVVELIMGLEDEFGVEISDEEAEGIRTVGDAVRFIAQKQ